MNVYECNSENIFMRRKIECYIKRRDTVFKNSLLNNVYHNFQSTQETAYFMSFCIFSVKITHKQSIITSVYFMYGGSPIPPRGCAPG